jgi:hypothetical protein
LPARSPPRHQSPDQAALARRAYSMTAPAHCACTSPTLPPAVSTPDFLFAHALMTSPPVDASSAQPPVSMLLSEVSGHIKARQLFASESPRAAARRVVAARPLGLQHALAAHHARVPRAQPIGTPTQLREAHTQPWHAEAEPVRHPAAAPRTWRRGHGFSQTPRAEPQPVGLTAASNSQSNGKLSGATRRTKSLRL